MAETAPLRSAPRALPAAAILFDLDGTLADTAGDLAGALNRVRAEHGLAPLPAHGLAGLPAAVSAPFELADALRAESVRAGQQVELGAWDVRVLTRA